MPAVFADSDMDGLKNARPRHVTAVVGDSGTGKSSLVKSDISSRTEDINLIWLSQDELDKPNQHVLASSLGIADDLPTLVGHSMKPVYLVLDARNNNASACVGTRFRSLERCSPSPLWTIKCCSLHTYILVANSSRRGNVEDRRRPRTPLRGSTIRERPLLFRGTASYSAVGEAWS